MFVSMVPTSAFATESGGQSFSGLYKGTRDVTPSVVNVQGTKTWNAPQGKVPESLQVILKQNGLRPIRFHDLRHSTASLMLANGVPMKMIQDWLGHSDMGTTASIYSHLDSNSMIASVGIIGNALALIDEG